MDYLTTGQVARLYGVARKTVREWVKKGRFPGTVRLPGTVSRWEYRIPATAVVARMEDKE
jgi:excisionase family DNA binding protein